MSTVAEAAGESPASSMPPAARPLAETLVTLLRRELWEHRYLWIAPLAVAVLLALGAVIGHVQLDNDDAAKLVEPEQRVALFSIVTWGVSVPFYVLMVFTLSYYTLDCLYAERKDRSILFWKSLPVSDALTVLSKLLMALLLAPFGVFLLGALTGIVVSLIMSLRVAAGGLPMLLSWSTLEWLRTETALLLVQILAVLWYAPLAGYLLAISAWARRSPFLWATLPLVLAPLLERLVFGSHFLWDFIRYRSNGIWQLLAAGRQHVFSRHGMHPVGSLLEDLNFRGAFTDIDLWLGVAATAALVWVAVRLRRYRDDT